MYHVVTVSNQYRGWVSDGFMEEHKMARRHEIKAGTILIGVSQWSANPNE